MKKYKIKKWNERDSYWERPRKLSTKSKLLQKMSLDKPPRQIISEGFSLAVWKKRRLQAIGSGVYKRKKTSGEGLDLIRVPKKDWLLATKFLGTGSNLEMDNLKEKGILRISKKRRKPSMRMANIPEHLFFQSLLQRSLLPKPKNGKSNLRKIRRNSNAFIQNGAQNKKSGMSIFKKKNQKKSKENRRISQTEERIRKLENWVNMQNRRARDKRIKLRRRSKLKRNRKDLFAMPVNKNVCGKGEHKRQANAKKGGPKTLT